MGLQIIEYKIWQNNNYITWYSTLFEIYPFTKMVKTASVFSLRELLSENTLAQDDHL